MKAVVVILIFCSTALAADEQPTLLQQLLEEPGPAPDWRKVTTDYTDKNPPAEDAPFDILLPFWASDRWESHNRRTPAARVRPSERVRQRLLEGLALEPQWLNGLHHWFDGDTAAYPKLKAAYDALDESDQWQKEPMREWFRPRTLYFRDDLIRAVNAVTFDLTHLRLLGEDEMKALALLDWNAAQPLLDKHIATGEPNLSAAALVAGYERHISAGDATRAGQTREKLRAVAISGDIVPETRCLVIKSLMRAQWAGRDEWFIGLFANRRLGLFGELVAGVFADPDFWVPKVIALLGDKDEIIHNNAVRCLEDFCERTDVLKALLPWLSDPNWSTSLNLSTVLEALGDVDLAEAVPGLLHVLKNGDTSEKRLAAVAIARYRTSEAGPLIRKLITSELPLVGTFFSDRDLPQAMIDCGGLRDDEIADTLIAAAIFEATPRPRDPTFPFEIPVRVPPAAEMGRYIAGAVVRSDSTTKAVLKRLDSLAAGQFEARANLLRWITDWPSAEIDRYLAARLGKHLDFATIECALARSETLIKNARAELEQLARGEGASAAVAVAFLNDADNANRILDGTDRAAQALLLATARLTRAELPLARVDQLIDIPELRASADKYLEFQDSPEARRRLYARSPNQARIIGFRDRRDSGDWTIFPDQQESLRKEILADDAPDEIFALLTTNSRAGHTIIRIRAGIATLSVENRTTPLPDRKLTDAELTGLHQLLADLNFDDLPYCETGVIDGTQEGYIHLTRAGGRRVFMNNPWYAAGSAYDRVSRRFARLANNR